MEIELSDKASETVVIATLIRHPEWYFTAEYLEPGHFDVAQNQCLYLAIANLAKRGISTVDAYNIVEALDKNSNITLEQIQDFINISEDTARSTIEEYKLAAQNVLDASFKRDSYKVLKECLELCKKLPKNELEKEIYNNIDQVMSGYSGSDDIIEFKDVVDQLWKEVEEHQDGKYGGIPFKFPTLNEYVRIEQGELVVVGAPAKGAKSMFMLNEAVDILKQGKSVFYLDSELSSRLFLCRLVSHLTGIEFARIRSGRYTEEEGAKIKEQKEWIKKQRFVHLYLPIFQNQTIYTAVKKANHRFGHLDVLIVDYIKPTGSSTEAYTVYAELGNLVDMIKNELCGSLGIAGLAAAQLTANNKLADSAKIVRNASTILLLTDKTPAECEADGEEGGRKKLIVSQNRNGMQHVDGEWINIDFNGNICTLTEAKQCHIPETPY